MAKYSADIEIAVRGGQQLNNTIKSLNRLNNSINVVNRNAKLLEGKGFNVASIENYSRAVSKAERAVRKAAEGTNQERQAITALVSAMELENKARERKNLLIAREIANQRRVVATANAGFGVQGPAMPGYMQGPAVPPGGIPRKSRGGGGGSTRGAGSRLGGAISGSIIGGAFPLLFGQGAGAAAGGAAGGLIGGLFGPGGSFAGSLLGTLLGDIAEQGGKIKELAADIGFSADQTTRLQQAFALAGQEADKFQAAVQNIRGLGLTLDDQADAIALAANLTEAYGGKIDKIAAAYANFVEKGKVGISDINKFTSEGIPILDALERKYNTNRDGVLKLAKDGKISAQDLSDALINIGNSSDTAVKKTVSGWDKAWADIKAGGSLLVQAVGAYFGALAGSASSSTGSIAESFASMFKNIVQNSIDVTAALARNLANLARFAANLSATFELGGLNIGAIASKNIAKNVEKTARDFDASLQKIQLPTPGTVGPIAIPGQAPATGDGGKGKGKAKQERESQLADILAANGLFRSQETIAARIAVAEVDRNTAEVARLQHIERSVQLLHEAAAIHRSSDPINEKQAKLRGVQDKLVASTNQYEREIAAEKIAQVKAANEIIADLELELKLKTATTEQERERLRLEAERAKLQGKGFTPEQIGTITGLQAQVAAPLTDAQKIEQHIGKLKDEVAELTNIGNIAITVADGIGTAFGQAFQGLISGSMTAKEALGSFFKSVGDMFVEMAAKIIAKQMTMIILQTILKALGGGFGGGGGGLSSAFSSSGPTFNPGAFSMPSLAANGATFANGIAKFANGGIVSSPTLFKFADGGATRTGLMGEAGPEAIMPLKRGADGSLGVQANGLREAMGAAPGAAAGSPVLNMSFQSTTINGVEYVSRDQLEAAMAQTRRQASRDGAQRGMTMTLDRIQNSSSTRRRIGV